MVSSIRAGILARGGAGLGRRHEGKFEGSRRAAGWGEGSAGGVFYGDLWGTGGEGAGRKNKERSCPLGPHSSV